MTVIYAGDFSTHWSTEAMVADALEAEGHSVIRMQDSHYTTASAQRFILTLTQLAKEPLYFLFSKCRLRDLSDDSPNERLKLTLFLRDLRGNKIKVLCWYWDLLAPEFSSSRFEWGKKISANCDIFFTTDGFTAPLLSNAVVLHQGFPREQKQGKIQERFRCDVAHIGSAYGPRRQWLTHLNRNFSTGVFNKVRNDDDLFDLCHTAKLVLGPTFPYYPRYWSNRIYMLGGYGACLALPEVEGMFEEGWIAHVHYFPVPYDSLEGYIEAIKEILNVRESLRDDIRRNSQRLVFEKFTYRHRIRELVSHLEKLNV